MSYYNWATPSCQVSAGSNLKITSYRSRQTKVGSTPTMPTFLLIRKTTNTPSMSQDSVEMPVILWRIPQCGPAGSTMAWISQLRMPTTTRLLLQTIVRRSIVLDGGTTTAGCPVSLAHMGLISHGKAWFICRRGADLEQRGWWSKARKEH